VADEPAEQPGPGQQQEPRHKEGGRLAAGPGLSLAGDRGDQGHPGAQVAVGGHGHRHHPDLVAGLPVPGRRPRRHQHRYRDPRQFLAPAGQQGAQRPGDGGEDYVVDGAAVGTSQGAHAGQADGDDVEPALRPGRLVERRPRQPARRAVAQFGQALPEPASRRVGGAPQPPRPGVGRERARARGRDRELLCLPVWRARELVHQAAQHRQPGDAVRQHVVHDDDQAGPAAGQPGDEHRRPQRPASGQRGRELGRRQVEQRPLVARRRAARLTDVGTRVERRVVGPVRASAARRCPVQPLPEPGHRPDPLAEQPPRLRHAEARSGVQHQDGAYVPGRAPGTQGQLHQIGPAGPVHPWPARPWPARPWPAHPWPARPPGAAAAYRGVSVMTDHPYSRAASLSSSAVGGRPSRVEMPR
jgi:hypothetical protein